MNEDGKDFWIRKDGKPASPEDVVRLKAKMELEGRVRKALDASPKIVGKPVKTDEEKEQERVDYMRSRSPRHLGSEG